MLLPVREPRLPPPDQHIVAMHLEDLRWTILTVEFTLVVVPLGDCLVSVGSHLRF